MKMSTFFTESIIECSYLLALNIVYSKRNYSLIFQIAGDNGLLPEWVGVIWQDVDLSVQACCLFNLPGNFFEQVQKNMFKQQCNIFELHVIQGEGECDCSVVIAVINPDTLSLHRSSR